MPHVPRVRVQWDDAKLGLSAKKVDETMAREDPRFFSGISYIQTTIPTGLGD